MKPPALPGVISPRKGLVGISVSSDGTDAVIEVQDDGPGIPPEHQARIFETFYRVDKARTRDEGGTGLGLSIAAWAVSVHKGTIEVQSEPGSGSVFRIRLPKQAVTANEVASV